MRAPPSLRHEHDRLHAALDRATRAPGRVGEAARTLARIMHLHLQREDEYATPPLMLLPDLAAGHVTPVMRDVLPLVKRLEAEMPLMLEEHRAIQGALEELRRIARDEQRTDIAEFAEALELHEQQEEEILYPAALLVGKYLKLILER